MAQGDFSREEAREVSAEEAREALDFAERARRNGRGAHRSRELLFYAALSAVLAGVMLYSILGTPRGWVVLLLIGVIVAGSFAAVRMTAKRSVRPSYRQDPRAVADNPRGMGWGGVAVITCPALLAPLVEGHAAIAVIVCTLWGLAAFWYLQRTTSPADAAEQKN